MKKKLIWGFSILLFAGINILQGINFSEKGITINELFTMSYAQSEDDPIYFVN